MRQRQTAIQTHDNSKPAKTEHRPTVKLISLTNRERATIHLANSIFTLTWLLIILNPGAQQDTLIGSVLNNIVKLLVPFYLLLTLHHWYKTTREFNYHSEPIKNEIKKTKKLTSEIKNSYYVLRRENTLARTYANDVNPFAVTLFKPKPDTYFDWLKFTWNIGTNELEKQAKQVHHVIRFLEKTFKENEVFISLKKENKKLFIEQDHLITFSTYKKFLPHISHKIDFPSKARVMHYSTLTALFGSTALYNLNSLFSENKINFFALYLTYSFILTSFAIAESHVLNKTKMQLNLEGFTNFFRPYHEWPPTCIGQQLSQQLALYPNNFTLNAVLDYLHHAKVFFKQLKKSNLIQKIADNEILKHINLLCEFVQKVDLKNTPIKLQDHILNLQTMEYIDNNFN